MRYGRTTGVPNTVEGSLRPATLRLAAQRWGTRSLENLAPTFPSMPATLHDNKPCRQHCMTINHAGGVSQCPTPNTGQTPLYSLRPPVQKKPVVSRLFRSHIIRCWGWACCRLCLEDRGRAEGQANGDDGGATAQRQEPTKDLWMGRQDRERPD